LKRLTISLPVLICAGGLLVPSALAGQSTEPKPPTLTPKMANHYAKKGTAKIFITFGRPIHSTYGSRHTEQVVTYAFQSLDPCRRVFTRSQSYFGCTLHFTSTVFTGGEYPKEEVINVVRHERVVVEPLSAHVPKQPPKTEARFPFRKGFRVVVAF
jgi:hypothetical protein